MNTNHEKQIEEMTFSEVSEELQIVLDRIAANLIKLDGIIKELGGQHDNPTP